MTPTGPGAPGTEFVRTAADPDGRSVAGQRHGRMRPPICSQPPGHPGVTPATEGSRTCPAP